MATQTADVQRDFGDISRLNDVPMIASDIIYKGAAVGMVEASGHARPLQSGDVFLGFALEQCDNSAGAAAAKDVWIRKAGYVELAVSGAVITDVGQPVYATDDNTFVFNPVGGVFVGLVTRFVSSGVVEVTFDAGKMKDPYGDGVKETISGATKTLDIEDNGKTFFVTVDSVITLPATATPLVCKVVNAGAFGTVQISLDPQAADKIQGPDIAGADNKDLINTKATAQRGDYAVIDNSGNADGAIVTELRGTWATEA